MIQSFKSGEVTPEQANEIGQALTEKIVKGYEDGKKYQSSKKDLYKLRNVSDQLCDERGLSVVKEYSAQERYTLAEKSLIEKGKTSWKDEIRQVIDHERIHTKVRY